jgi:hypothetical protein
MAKYRVQTDNGTYEVEVDDNNQPQQKPGLGNYIDVAKILYQNVTPMGQIANAANTAGEAIATGLAGHGVNPQLAAGVGTAMQMAPDIATAMAGGPKVAQAAEETVPAITDAAKAVGKRMVMGKNTERIIGLKNDAASLIEQKANKLAQLEQLRSQAGTGIETARNVAEIPQKLSGLPQIGKTVDETADFFKTKIGGMKSEDLAKAYGKDGLAQLRDAGQSVKESGVNATQNAFINRGIGRIDEAMQLVAPDVAEGYKNYGTVKDAIEATPQDFMNKRIALQNQIRNLQPGANTEKAVRYGLGVGAGATPFMLAALKKLSGLGK